VTGPGDTFAGDGAGLVRERTAVRPQAALILGSGLGPAADGIEADAEISFADLPGFPEPSVPGHAGRLVIGHLGGVPVAAFLGRVHLYEGHPMSLVTLPTRLIAAMGAGVLVVTAAVGGLDPSLGPGTMIVGTDHLNFLGEGVLRGWTDDEGRPAFVDLSEAYDRILGEAAIRAAQAEGLPVARGVYASMPGPVYETPAEVAFLRQAGAAVVGMSVVPEVTAGAALGLRCLGLYCVTNVVGKPVSHGEVTEVAEAFAPRLGGVLTRLLPSIGA
jgi:purine-nucleoside phosphorylase